MTRAMREACVRTSLNYANLTEGEVCIPISPIWGLPTSPMTVSGSTLLITAAHSTRQVIAAGGAVASRTQGHPELGLYTATTLVVDVPLEFSLCDVKKGSCAENRYPYRNTAVESHHVKVRG